MKSIRAAADGNTVDLWLLSEITSWTAADFMSAADYYGTDKNYILNIHSPGGDPFSAFAIHDYIKAKGLKVTSRIWGHAASAAAIIAASTQRVEMGELSHLMIHNAYGGSSTELLDSLNEKQAQVFAARTGKKEKAIRSLMDAETWMDAATAKAEGFADAIIKELALAALYKASYMEENKPVEVAEVAAPETVEEVVETPAETVAETTVIEQEVEVTATDMVNAALGKKKRVSFDVSAHFTSAINALADEVKEKGDALAEAEAEVVRLKEQIEALQTQAATAETEATTAKAEADAVKAMFEQVKSELAQVSAEPVTPAAEAAKSEGAAAVPGKMIPEGKQTKKQQYESKVAELYGHFVPNKTKA